MALGHCGRDRTFPTQNMVKVRREQHTPGRGVGTKTFKTDTEHGWRAVLADYAVRSSSLRKGCADSAFELELAMREYWIAKLAGMNDDFFLTEGQCCTGLRLDLRFGRGAPSPEHRSPGSLPPNLLSPSSFFRRIYIIPSCLKGGNAPGWNCFLKSMKEILHWTSANFDGSPSELWHLS